MASPTGQGKSQARKHLPRRADTAHPSHAYRARLHVRSQERKQRRNDVANARHKVNVRRGYTGWQLARARRAERRGHATPEQGKILEQTEGSHRS